MKKKTVTRRKRTGKAKVSKTVKRYVKKQISANIENKCFVYYGANTNINTAGASLDCANLYLLPLLSQGTGQANRIGNQIKIKKAVVKGYVNIIPYNATTNPLTAPVMVKMWLVSHRKSMTFATGATSNFFETGNSSTGFQGNMLDMVLTVNKEAWLVHKTKTFKIGAGSNTTTGPISSNAYFDNSPMNKPFSFNFGKYIKAKLRYDDTGTTPTNKNMYLFIQAVYSDGSSNAVTPAEYHYDVRIDYEDA